MHMHMTPITFARSLRFASSVWTPCRRSLTQDTASVSSAGCASSNPYAFAKASKYVESWPRKYSKAALLAQSQCQRCVGPVAPQRNKSAWLTWGVCLELKLERRDGAGKRMRRSVPRAKDTRTVLQFQARLPCRGSGYAMINTLLRSSRSDHET